jgi:hypothetical protein
MEVKAQAPFPKVEIYSPESKTATIVFDSSTDGQSLDGLLSYRFSTDTNSLDGQFQFTVENSMKDKDAVFNKIDKKDVVKIYEGGKHPVFIGVIHEKKVSVSMTEKGIKRGIQFTGNNILGILHNFILSMDLKLMSLMDAQKYSQDLTIKLTKEDGEKLKIKEFLKTTLEDYVALNLANMKVSDTKVFKILETHVAKNLADIFSLDDEDAEFYFPIACAFYNQGQNRITEIWRNILAAPVYEMFPVIINGGPKIKVREAPFDNSEEYHSWKELPSKEIHSVDLTDYDLTESDNDVYTFFNCYIIGSALSPDQYTITSQLIYGEGIAITDKEKFGLYGYRPLEVGFRGYARRSNLDEGNNSDMKTKIKVLNERMRNWYSKLDEMLNGTITITTDFKDTDPPQPGEKIKLFNGEFYVNKSDHSWTYGGTPKTVLTVTRGMIYGDNGKTKKMKNVGMRLAELEAAK